MTSAKRRLTLHKSEMKYQAIFELNSVPSLKQFLQIQSDSNEMFSLVNTLGKFIEKTEGVNYKQTLLQDCT